jgi:hypothetical protein
MLRAAGGHVAALPPARQQRRVRVPWWLVVTVIAALAWLFLRVQVALG